MWTLKCYIVIWNENGRKNEALKLSIWRMVTILSILRMMKITRMLYLNDLDYWRIIIWLCKDSPPMFLQEAEVSNKVVVQFWIPKLPMKWNCTTLNSLVGSKTLWVPCWRSTSWLQSTLKGTYVCICFKIDLDKPLVPFNMICSYKFMLECEGFYAICFTYDKYGHKDYGSTFDFDRALVNVNPKSQ